jgi:hypothetical protein
MCSQADKKGLVTHRIKIVEIHNGSEGYTAPAEQDLLDQGFHSIV